jgi:hypothetical protein
MTNSTDPTSPEETPLCRFAVFEKGAELKVLVAQVTPKQATDRINFQCAASDQAVLERISRVVDAFRALPREPTATTPDWSRFMALFPAESLEAEEIALGDSNIEIQYDFQSGSIVGTHQTLHPYTAPGDDIARNVVAALSQAFPKACDDLAGRINAALDNADRPFRTWGRSGLRSGLDRGGGRRGQAISRSAFRGASAGIKKGRIGATLPVTYKFVRHESSAGPARGSLVFSTGTVDTVRIRCLSARTSASLRQTDAVVANAEACLRWLDRRTPDLNAARRSVEWVIDDGNRASEVIRRVRALAKKTDIEKVPLDVNHVVREVVALVQREMTSHRVSLRMELAPSLSVILGDRVQLQQVMLNLVMNGIEAMQSVADRPLELVIRSRQDETQRMLVSVDGLRRRNLRRECGPAVQRLLHHQDQRHGHGTLDLPFDHRSPWWSAVGHGKRASRCHVSVHPAGKC